MIKTYCRRFNLFLLMLLFNLLVISENVLCQENSLRITKQGFNRIVIQSPSGTERIIPVTSSEDQLPGNISVVNESIKNINSSSDWTLLQSVEGVVKAVSFATPLVGYMAAEGGLVYKTIDGGYNWTTILNIGYPNHWYGVHAFSIDKVIISGFSQSTGNGMLRWTTNGGASWTGNIVISPGPMNWVYGVGFADSLHGLIVGATSSAGKVYITTNGGLTVNDWTAVTADPSAGWFAGNFTMRPNGKYYITGIKFCTSTDYGLTWTNRVHIDSVFDGGVSFPDDLHGWTGGGSISPTVEGWAHRTTDGGATWSNRILTLPYPVRVIYFFDSMTGFAQGGSGTIGGIWESTDGGVTWNEGAVTNAEMASLDWQRVSPDSIDIWSVGYTPAGGSYHSPVYKKRMYYIPVPVELTSFTASVKDNNVILEWTTATETNNKGFEIQRASSEQDWQQIGYLPGSGTTTEPKQYIFSDKELSTGIYNYRLKQIDLDGTFEYSSEINAEVTLPDEFTLSQNYPNPFNPSTVIEFGIPKESQVSLKIYDVLGNEIVTLVNEVKPAGKYEVKFNAGNLSSGVYYCTLKAAGFSSTKKLILMK